MLLMNYELEIACKAAVAVQMKYCPPLCL